MEQKSLPLAGITVVELSTVVAAPTAARILAAYGADVIKVEGVDGDVMRRFGTSYQVKAEDGSNPCFTLTNSGKNFISINLKTGEGKEVMHRLLKQADVFISNVRPKSLERLGLDYASARDTYPSLIYAHFSGFGPTGPDRDRPGYDTCAFWLRCGGMLDWLTPGSFPLRPVYGFGDMATSAQLVSGILMALLGREKTGKGTEVSVSLYANGLWLNSFGVISAQPQYGRPFMSGPCQPYDAFSDYYQCSDGTWLGFFCNEYAREKEKLARVFGMPELLEDPNCASLTVMRQTHTLEAVCQKLREIFLTKTREEWCAILREADIAYDKLLHYAEVYPDPQAWENGYLEEVAFEDGTTTAMPMPPIQFTSYARRKTVPTGAISQDAQRILTGLGYSEAQIGQLRACGAIV